MSLSVLIDTNVMMVALSPKSELHWIYKRLIKLDFPVVNIIDAYEFQRLLRNTDS